VIFVGRDAEIKQMIKAIHQERNIIIEGKFGIGRTSLIKKISHSLADERMFIFVDFSQTPGKMSEKIMKELGLSRRVRKTGGKMKYKPMRYRIATAGLSVKDKPVIVLDNVGGLTPQKIIFLRNLMEEKRFQFIAIVENFMPLNDFMRLQVQLYPAETITLKYLRSEEVFSLIRLYSDKYHLYWPDTYIRKLASWAGRYPLGIIEMIRKQTAERNSK